MKTKDVKKVLITGGTGFIGSYTADFYAKKGREMVVLDNLSREQILVVCYIIPWAWKFFCSSAYCIAPRLLGSSAVKRLYREAFMSISLAMLVNFLAEKYSPKVRLRQEKTF